MKKLNAALVSTLLIFTTASYALPQCDILLATMQEQYGSNESSGCYVVGIRGSTVVTECEKESEGGALVRQATPCTNVQPSDPYNNPYNPYGEGEGE